MQLRLKMNLVRVSMVVIHEPPELVLVLFFLKRTFACYLEMVANYTEEEFECVS